MPLVRYRTGDIGRFLGGDCPCGTTLKSLERVRSRAGGCVAVGGQWQLMMADLEEALFPLTSVLDFSATISHEGALDRLQLEVRVVAGTSDNIAGLIDDALKSIPAVKLARLSGQFQVVISVETTHFVIAHPIKRTIRDVRTQA
jgi:phenylacetate-CoA ligase